MIFNSNETLKKNLMLIVKYNAVRFRIGIRVAYRPYAWVYPVPDLGLKKDN